MRTALALALATLVGCAVGPSRSEVLASLVGRPEADALRVLGAPNGIIPANGSKFLAYDSQSVRYAPAPWGPFGYGVFMPAAIPYVNVCETTVEIAGGVVRSWTLRGNGC